MRLSEPLAYPPRDRLPAMLCSGRPAWETRIVQRFVREHGSRFDPQRCTIRLRVAAPQTPPTPLRARFLRGAAGFGHGGAVLPVKLSVSNVRKRVRGAARQLRRGSSSTRSIRC